MPVESFTTNVDNIRQDSPEWVTKKIGTELLSLEKEMFYTVKEDGNVDCDMHTVKSYLESIKNLNWGALKEKGSAWVMSVQIALESIKDENGKSKYDVGVIDGQFGSNTRSAVRKFQEDCGFTGKDLDGYPGKMTIGKLLEKLGDQPVTSANPVDQPVTSANPVDQPVTSANPVDQPVEGSGNNPVEGSGDKMEESRLDKIPKKTYAHLYREIYSIMGELEGVGKYEASQYERYPKNPMVGLHVESKGPYKGYISHKNYSLNLNDYYDRASGMLDSEQLKNKIVDLRDKYDLEVKKEVEEKEDANKFIAYIKDKNYALSLEDLFSEEVNSGDNRYKAFIDQFPNGNVKFDRNTYFLENELSIGVKSKIYKISKKELKGEDGKFSEELLKEKLKNIFKDIIENGKHF